MPATSTRDLPPEWPAWQPTSDRVIRMGVVGGGFGGCFHWHEHPNGRVVAVADARPDRLNRLRTLYGCERSYPGLEELLADDEVEAVALFTPAPDHARHAVMVMEAGKQVISAVPTCTTLEEARELVKVKERTGRTYMMAETSFYRWESITARRMHRAGAFGELVYSEAEYYHPLNGAEREALWFYQGQRTWRYGFAPMLYPTHTTGFLVGVTRERLTRVSCLGYGGGEPALRDNVYGNPHSNQVAMFLTDQGHAFRGNVCWNVHAHGERAQWLGTEASLYMPDSAARPYRVVWSDGSVETEGPDYWPTLPPSMRVDTGHGAAHPFLTHEFLTALVAERAPVIDLYEALAMTVPGIVAYRSALEGGVQLAIPSFDPS
ncbi:MAG: Gfo/Idh/MocA family oxidoreductase [Armatimonadetes bacterium]|nr:Gfo/Idh/MocA family oxidoreductase [Armatimonadota bacterium]